MLSHSDPGPASAATGVSCLATSAQGFQALTGAPAADFACGLNPPSFVRSPAQVGFTRDGTQLVVTVKGTNTIYVFPVDTVGRPVSYNYAGPRAGVAHLFRLYLHQEWNPAGHRAFRYSRKHPCGRQRRGLVLRGRWRRQPEPDQFGRKRWRHCGLLDHARTHSGPIRIRCQ